MDARIEYRKVAPGGFEALGVLDAYVRQSGLEPALLDLVDVRASQINGCAFCLDMHSQDARARGETEQRLYTLQAWNEAPFYTERERAALAWTEAVTQITQGHVPDDVYDAARRQFNEKELVDLTLAIIAINGHNRLATTFRKQAGRYVSPIGRGTVQ